MRRIAIHEIEQQIQWVDQHVFSFYILVDEATGEVGIPNIMESIEADLCNTAFRLSGSPWRWFVILEKEMAN